MGRISVACDGAPTAGAVKAKITGKATIPVMNITAASTAQIRRNCGVVMLTKIRKPPAPSSRAASYSSRSSCRTAELKTRKQNGISCHRKTTMAAPSARLGSPSHWVPEGRPIARSTMLNNPYDGS